MALIVIPWISSKRRAAIALAIDIAERHSCYASIQNIPNMSNVLKLSKRLPEIRLSATATIPQISQLQLKTNQSPFTCKALILPGCSVESLQHMQRTVQLFITDEVALVDDHHLEGLQADSKRLVASLTFAFDKCT